MKITEIALRKQTFAAALLVVVAGLGAWSYRSLPKAENPGFTVRTAVVLARWPGATTAQTERLVTDPLEAEVQRMEELDFVESYSRAGQSVVRVHIRETVMDLEPVWTDLRNKVDDAAARLPAGVRGPFVDTDFGDVFGTVLAVWGEGLPMRELEEVAELAELTLLELEDAGQVQIVGDRAERVYIEPDPAVLERYGLAPVQLADILRERNALEEAGFVRGETERLLLVTSGNLDVARQLRDVLVPIPGSAQTVPLEQLATVRTGYADPPRVMAFRDGHPAVVIGVSMKEGGNITELGPKVLETAERLGRQLPRGAHVELVSYQPGVVDRKIGAFLSNLVQGLVSVLLVTLVALGLRMGLVVGSLVPMTMLSAVALMNLLGIGIDQMSLAALIIALGLLVDAGIVIAESILVRMEAGEDRWDAARGAVSELRTPLLVSVGTTVAALSPTILADSAVGEYTAPISQVVAITLSCSWLLAVTLTPLLSAKLLRVKSKPEATSEQTRTSPPYRAYRGLLRWSLRHRWLVFVGALGLLAGAAFLARYVPQAFFPGKRVQLVEAEIELPFDAHIHATRDVVARLEAKIDAYRLEPDEPGPGVVAYTTFVGSGGLRYILPYAPEAPRENYAYVLIQTRGVKGHERMVTDLSRWARAELPGVRVRVGELRNGPPVAYPVEVRLFGLDAERLYAEARALKARMQKIDGLTALNDNWYPPVKRISVDLDPVAKRQATLTRGDVTKSIRAQTSGLPVATLRRGTELVPVELRPPGGPRASQLDGLSIFDPGRAETVPLERVARLNVASEPGQVYRYDRMRTIAVRADLEPSADATAFAVQKELTPWLESRAEGWPLGYGFEFGGEVEESSQARSSIFEKVPFAVAVILMLLVWQFDSLRKPLAIVLLLPFGLVGVVLALLASQKSFGFMALLGVIAMFGVVINNAIVLIAQIEQHLEEGEDPHHAVIEASARRVRPILLTTLTTVGGLVPLSLSGGPLFSPLGTAMLGGLIFGTAITLGLCPTLFAALYRIHEQSGARGATT